MGCVGSTAAPTATPVPFKALQLHVKLDPKESATILLNPSPLGEGGYSQGMVVTIDILPKLGGQVDKWVGPVYNRDGNTAQIQMDSTLEVAVRLKPTTPPTATPTTVPTATPQLTVTPWPMATPRPTPKTSADSYFDKGMEYYDAENWSMAVEEFTLAIRINFRLEDAYFYRGYAHHELGQYQNAIADYTKAIKIDPDDGLAYYYRSHTYWRISQKGKLKEDRRKACSLDSRYCGLYE
jgi:hypothetical protein